MFLKRTVKKRVRSWDVFDTLIARRCGLYLNIFEIMEASLQCNFPEARVNAEQHLRMSKSELTLSAIYDLLRERLNWSAEQSERAMALEVATELANVIPISSNIDRVKDGDILVSDMYLDKETIWKLLKKAGFNKDVELFVSLDGKSSGSIWKIVKKRYSISLHRGDNFIGDFVRPWLSGIPSLLVDESSESDAEDFLRNNRAPELGCFLREFRLKRAVSNSNTNDLQLAQLEGNFPFLLLASALLIKWCEENNVSAILMCSRDCVLWEPMVQKVSRVLGAKVSIEYFYSSRVTSFKPSDAYLSYAKKRFKYNPVVVDLSMTGVSLSKFAEKLDLDLIRAYVIYLVSSSAKALYGKNVSEISRVSFEAIFSEYQQCDIGAFNQAGYPSIQHYDACIPRYTTINIYINSILTSH